MNKKTVKFLSIFLIIISISTICYAGFGEVNISEKVPMNFFEQIKIFFEYLISNLLDAFIFLDYTIYYSHSTLFGIEFDYYIVAGIIVLYTIINCLIIRKKKELSKIAFKTNIIILLILLALLISFISIIREHSYKLMISVTLTLLIMSLTFQKVISKKDNEIIKKYNHILKKIIVILIILASIISSITYKCLFFKSYYGLDDVDSEDEILVEVIEKTVPVYDPTFYERGKYTVSIGEIMSRTTAKVLDIDNDGVLIQYTESKYVKEETRDDYVANNYFGTHGGVHLSDGFKNYKKVSEEKEMKLKWNIWYSYGVPANPNVLTEGYGETYIRVIKNK